MTLRTRIPISEHAAAQEPSKLGLAPGDTISVDDAIKAVVTRSANDIAVAIAEAIGQSESNFADMMTRKARALGMTQHGLRQRVRTAQRRADHHGARSDDPRTLARGAVPALLPLFLDRPVRLRRRDHRQPQSPARPRRRRRRHQDRLHPSLRLQSPDLGPSRRTVAARRRHGRALRRRARPDHGEPDRRPHRRSFDRAYRDRSRGRFARRDGRAAHRTGRDAAGAGASGPGRRSQV